jgi:hypothetical protein
MSPTTEHVFLASLDVPAHGAQDADKLQSHQASLERHRVCALFPEVQMVASSVPQRYDEATAPMTVAVRRYWSTADGVDQRAPSRREKSRDGDVCQVPGSAGSGRFCLRSPMSVWCMLAMAIHLVCHHAFVPCHCFDESKSAIRRCWSFDAMILRHRPGDFAALDSEPCLFLVLSVE